MSIEQYAFAGCTALSDITIPNSVATLGGFTFQNCSKLNHVNFSNKITEIGDGAFRNCTSLKSISIPNSVVKIGSWAFEGCIGLQIINIPNNVTTIESSAFEGCTELSSISLPSSLTAIGTDAFRDCWGLKKVIINDISAWLNVSFNGGDSNPIQYAGHIYMDDNSEITDLVIPNNVTSIGFAFSNCKGLTSVTIPNSVTYIERGAFFGCTGLSSITIPESVTAIGDDAFLVCDNLHSVEINSDHVLQHSFSSIFGTQVKEIIIGKDVTTIGDGVFPEYSNISSVTINSNELVSKNYTKDHSLDDMFGKQNKDFVIGDDVIAIGDYAFSGQRVNSYTNSVRSSITSLKMGKGIKHVGNFAFSDCFILPSLEFPNGVESIGNNACENCRNLVTVVMPIGLKRIGESAFNGCYELNSIKIPENLTSIGKYAFWNCSSLKNVISMKEIPIEDAKNQYWSTYNIKNITLFVPSGAKGRYADAEGWKNFGEIKEFGSKTVKSLLEQVEVNFANSIPSQLELSNLVIDNTYYNLSLDNGDGYNKSDGCIDLISETTDINITEIIACPISDSKVSTIFKGIMFMVPAGFGTVKVTAETIGSKYLKVKIGSNEAKSFSLAEKETIEIQYTVAEPTYVYIYAGSTGLISKSNSITSVEGEVKIYGYEWTPSGCTGLESVNSAAYENSAVYYSINGKQLSAPQKGLNIIKMSDGTTRKVVR